MASYRVISADSHIVETGDLWKSHIDPAYRDRAPHMVREGDTDWIVCEETRMGPPFGYSTAGNKHPTSRLADAVYPGAYDPDARLKEMARDGVDAEVIYPSLGLRAFNIPDVGLRRASLEAYNRWLGGFVAAYPHKLKGLAMVDSTDPALASQTLRTGHQLGLSGALITIEAEEPERYGTEELDPLWHTADELNMPVSLHILSNEKPIKQGSHIHETLQHGFIQHTLATMVFGGVFQRHPGLRVISAENDAGWAPYFMERMDYLFTDLRRQAYQDYAIKGGDLLPSEYVLRNVGFTFQRDASGVFVRSLVKVSNLMWASDYPHNDSTWPNSQELIARLFADVPEAETRQIVAENAAALYGFS